MIKIKTIYLADETVENLIRDIKGVFPDYEGQSDYPVLGEGGIRLIGDILVPVFDPQTGERIGETWVGKQHANIYVPEDFDETVFQTRMPEPPKNPVNRLAV